MSSPLGYSIYPKANYIVAVPEFEQRPYLRKELEANRKRQLSSLSVNARRKALNSMRWLANSAKRKMVYSSETGKRFWFKINFVTLTIPDIDMEGLTDRALKSCLDNFLLQLKRKSGLENYVWRAETQANGSLHFHIMTDVFIEKRQLMFLWNKALEPTGLIRAYKWQYGYEPRSTTRVEAVSSLSAIRGYMAKYMAKQEDGRRPVEGRIWGCSYSLSRIGRVVIDCLSSEGVSLLKEVVSDKALECKEIIATAATGARKHVADIFLFENPYLLKNKIGEVYKSLLHSIRNKLDIAYWAGTYQISSA